MMDIRSQRGLAVLVTGTVMSTRGDPHRLDARRIAGEYAEHDFTRFSELDGSFVVAMARPPLRL